MRDCKLWMGLPHTYSDRPCTVSSQVLQKTIKKEVRGANSRAVLNRRYCVMDASLRLMFEHEELRGATYSRLKILLRGEYEKRWEALTDEQN